MAYIAEIVVHSVCTSNLCFIIVLYLIGILFYPKVIFNIGDAFTSQITDVIERDDNWQLLLNAHSFSTAVLHDLQFPVNWVDHNNCAGQTHVLAGVLCGSYEITHNDLHAPFDLQELVGQVVLLLIGKLDLLHQQFPCTLIGNLIIETVQSSERTENLSPVGNGHPRMLGRRLRPGEVEDIRILPGNQPPFLGILEVCHKILPPLLGLVTADLTVPFSHGCAFQIVGALQNSVLSELLLDTEHGLLQGFLPLQLAGVSEQIYL